MSYDKRTPILAPCHCGLTAGSCDCKSRLLDPCEPVTPVGRFREPDDGAIEALRQEIIDRQSLRRGIRNGAIVSSVVWALIILAGMFLAGCVSAPCPPGQCIGPYDLTLSSHREALRN